MKFLLDHDVPDDLSYLTEQLGHSVTLLHKTLPGDSSAVCPPTGESANSTSTTLSNLPSTVFTQTFGVL